MERKLGEIFTYNGKIYQVVKGFSCKGCAFIKNGCCDLVNELLGPCDYTKRTDKTNVIFKEINNMEIKNNQLTIDIPEGMEIDLENSDLAKGIVRFKQSTITYEDVEDTLKLDKNCKSIIINESNASKLVTLSRLMNIAKYYNGDWKPNWSDQNEYKYLSAIVDASTVCIFTGLTDKNGTPIYEGDIVIYRDNNAERRGSINWDSKAAAFYFGQDFLVHYPSENMVVVGNEFDI